MELVYTGNLYQNWIRSSTILKTRLLSSLTYVYATAEMFVDMVQDFFLHGLVVTRIKKNNFKSFKLFQSFIVIFKFIIGAAAINVIVYSGNSMIKIGCLLTTELFHIIPPHSQLLV